MQTTPKNSKTRARRRGRAGRLMFAAASLAMPALVWAQNVGAATERVRGFFDDVTGLLKVASIAVVTIAIIFAGYQIAFNHKRIGDVAPVLIGGFLIGAAAQLTQMLLSTDDSGLGMVLTQLWPTYA
ncbi:type VI secretion protein [Lysobacteraceae bacterium NML93-0399]|nr:type VI secretion protein [Xanthomonadaceae bacterium NML93-0399]